jgi:hypothetical protein
MDAKREDKIDKYSLNAFSGWFASISGENQSSTIKVSNLIRAEFFGSSGLGMVR